MDSYILGIDIGTGSTKGVALSLKGEVLASSQHRYPITEPQPGFSEQDPELIWSAFVKCVQEITEELDAPPEAISFSSAMHSLILVDEQGNVLHNMITWADTRSEAIAQKLRDSGRGEAVYRQTGTPIHPMSPLCKLIWLHENKAELFKQTAKFISVKEFIWFRLFKKFEVDYAIASATGLFDITELRWSKEACKLAGITTDVLSIPVDTNFQRKGITAGMAENLGIIETTIFVIGASDGCCANLGSYVTEVGTAALTIGTSGAVRITGSKPVYNNKAMPFNYLLNYNTFVSGGAVNNGGIAADWLLKKFLNIAEPDDDTYKDMFSTIGSVPAGSDGLVFLPYLYGERAPIWDANSSAAFLNIQPKHGQAHFLRAGLEGICYALYDVLNTLEESSGRVTQINISGGFINSDAWMQILADITGKKLVVLQEEDASTIGAIYLAVQSLYPTQSLPVAREKQTIEPNLAKHTLYAKTFPLYRKLYHDLKESMGLLRHLT